MPSITKRLISLLLPCALLIACSPEPQVSTKPVLTVTHQVLAAPVTAQYRDFIGQVVPAELTPLSFRIAGEISQVLIKPGEPVTKGQVLIKLDSRKAEQKQADTQAKMVLAQKQLSRARSLVSQQLISQAELDELIANVKLAEINQKLAEAQVKYSVIRAPFSGLVSEVNKENYETVAPSEPVVKLYQSDKIYVKIQLPDVILARFNPEKKETNYKPTLQFANGGTEHQVSLLEYTMQLTAQTQAYEAWFVMPQTTPVTLPGTTATVHIDLIKAGISGELGYQVPVNALDPGMQANQFYVWKLLDGKISKQAVDVVQMSSLGALVINGLNEGDRIVTSHLNQLREGMQVNSTTQEQAL
ncbi:Secretion protein HlyD [Shewanella denitrificans OS217]|jgi:RND family efflux transporter MFP subunit|uniref:Secretion protein HlyD n=1 Tax=Shewanella denitrificans (strain OS217 / ATCC BAA-1090 / DSM 15013) TaxID=318161 RepID=Q12P31_SHEDO|nr:efflux RND transporter periplasmic adaptor subunit [Shewanella denitrificans]ABE54795.1 Secretion protein HlyD [Shewanella denitrificans OS217]